MRTYLLAALAALFIACGSTVAAAPTDTPMPTVTPAPLSTSTPGPELVGSTQWTRCMTAMTLALRQHRHYYSPNAGQFTTSSYTDTAATQAQLFGTAHLAEMLTTECGSFVDAQVEAELKAAYGFR